MPASACYPGCELRKGGNSRSRANVIDGIDKNKQTNEQTNEQTNKQTHEKERTKQEHKANSNYFGDVKKLAVRNGAHRRALH